MKAPRLDLPDGPGSPSARAGRLRPELVDALGEVHAAAMKLDGLDRQTTELVRLCCARTHDCDTWLSLRLVGAGPVDDLQPTVPQRAAIRLAEAFTASPLDIGAELRDDLLRHFGPDQVLELLADIVAWTQQKIQVCLALDAPIEAGRQAALDFDEQGRPLVEWTGIRRDGAGPAGDTAGATPAGARDR